MLSLFGEEDMAKLKNWTVLLKNLTKIKWIWNKKEKSENNKKPNQLTNQKSVNIEAFFFNCSM